MPNRSAFDYNEGVAGRGLKLYRLFYRVNQKAEEFGGKMAKMLLASLVPPCCCLSIHVEYSNPERLHAHLGTKKTACGPLRQNSTEHYRR
jgi:uncharacterized protein YigA (DUF484 family)